jgi:nicotinate-nucleotide pyrophosphorylase (carboxylating)
MIPIQYLLRFIDEDVPAGDITSEAVIPEVTCRAYIKSEQDGIIAGLEEAALLFSHFGVKVTPDAGDGNPVKRGDVLITLDGPAQIILLVERTALNIIGRMSGIATRTRKMADLISSINPACRIAGTRKTSPGCRRLDKKAIALGGGDPHRYSLSDGILIKDNHLALTTIGAAIRDAKKVSSYKKIEVEVETCEDALVAARAGADIIMLDNMTPDAIHTTLTTISHEGLRDRIVFETSGGIDETQLKEYAALDLNVISMGSLTHTVKNFSVTLEIIPVKKQ